MRPQIQELVGLTGWKKAIGVMSTAPAYRILRSEVDHSRGPVQSKFPEAIVAFGFVYQVGSLCGSKDPSDNRLKWRIIWSMVSLRYESLQWSMLGGSQRKNSDEKTPARLTALLLKLSKNKKNMTGEMRGVSLT